MNGILKRLKSKTYLFNIAIAVGAFVEANTGLLGIASPQVIAGVALVNMILREMTNKPISAK